ncbi:MAG: hypothetical protein JO057_07515 [Chloroflexi bacterium]|nr:hypothetical protein [Chloroflexota bacterium]
MARYSFAERARGGEHVLAIRRVVVVLKVQPDLPGRDRGHEPFSGRSRRQGGLERRDVAVDELGSAPVDWPIAGGKGQAAARTRRVLGIKVRKHSPFDLTRHRPLLAVEACQSLGGVCRKASATHLAVAWHVDADLDLAADGLAHRGVDPLGGARLRQHLPLIATLDQVQDVLRARQTARVRGQDALVTAFHSGLHAVR